MDPVDALTKLGGVADAAALLRLTSRKRVRTATRRQRIVRLTRNRYALPTAGAGVATAGRLHGVASHLSAAAHHGWEIRFPPELPQVIVPRGRNIDAERRALTDLRWRRLPPTDVDGPATAKVRTVLDCAQDLPFPDALAVADSALRHGLDRAALIEAADRLRGPRAVRVRRVVALADGRAANPFESTLRAIALEEGLAVLPQQPVEVDGVVLHPDLFDARRRLVLEADSWTWHADKDAHERDCARYNSFVTARLVVLRFTWQQVMLSPSYVRSVLRAWIAGPPERSIGDPWSATAA